MIQLTERTKELLSILTRYSNNTRYTWIILNVVSLILISGIINEKYGGTRPRIAVRYWNSNVELIKALAPGNKETKTDSLKNNLKSELSKQLIDIDKNELEKLRGQQLLEFESVNIPLIGVSISSRDTTFIGAIGLLIIYLWYLLSVIKERSVLAQLIYPLIAKASDEKAKRLWGERDLKGNVNEDDLSQKIALYKKEIIHMKEAISSKFLTLYSNSKRRWFEYLTTGVLTFVPLILLVIALSLDIHWDFFKKFKETGMTFKDEIAYYQDSLAELSERLDVSGNESDIELCNKLELASEQLETYNSVMVFKRVVSSVIVIILASICVYDLVVAGSMTRILTDMNEDPRKLHLEKFLDA